MTESTESIAVKFPSNSSAYQYSRARQNLHTVQALEPVEKERSGATRWNNTMGRQDRRTRWIPEREKDAENDTEYDGKERRQRTTAKNNGKERRQRTTVKQASGDFP